MSLRNSPPASSSRERSSSHTETPNSESRASALVMVSTFRRAFYGRSGGAGRGEALLGGRREALLGGGRDVLLGDADLLVQLLVVAGRPEVLQGHASAGVPDDLAPTLRHARLHGDARADRGREDGVVVRLVLPEEPLPARHGHHPGRNAFALQELARGDG